MNKPEDYLKQANLSASLYNIMVHHYNEVQSEDKTTAKPLPMFISETLHTFCTNIAKIVNTDMYDTFAWKDIADTANTVTDIINNAVKNQKGENNE